MLANVRKGTAAPSKNRYPRFRCTAGVGRFKPVDFDVAMTGEGSTAAVGRAQFDARTRPSADVAIFGKRTLVDLA
jgi:hypothetical protein